MLLAAVFVLSCCPSFVIVFTSHTALADHRLPIFLWSDWLRWHLSFTVRYLALPPPLTGSIRRVVHEEHGCNKWKKTLACLLVLSRLQAKIVRCGGRYDPQLVKRSSEWDSEWEATRWTDQAPTCHSSPWLVWRCGFKKPQNFENYEFHQYNYP